MLLLLLLQVKLHMQQPIKPLNHDVSHTISFQFSFSVVYFKENSGAIQLHIALMSELTKR